MPPKSLCHCYRIRGSRWSHRGHFSFCQAIKSTTSLSLATANICIYYIYRTSLFSQSRVSFVFTISYTSLGIYIVSQMYMFIQNIHYTDYSLCLSVLLSLKLTWYQSQINILALWFLNHQQSLQSCISHLPLLPHESFVQRVPPTAPFIRACYSITRNLVVKNLSMCSHTPILYSTFLHVSSHQHQTSP